MIDLYANEKTLILIDGQSLRQTLASLGVELDYRRLLRHVRSHSKLRRALYATILAADETIAPRTFTNWLELNGFSLVSRIVKPVFNETGVPQLRGDARVELAVAAMELAPQVDHVLLFSSHSSLSSLVVALKTKGIRVTVISSLVARPGGVADDLRRAADNFVELQGLDLFFLDRDTATDDDSAQVASADSATPPVGETQRSHPAPSVKPSDKPSSSACAASHVTPPSQPVVERAAPVAKSPAPKPCAAASAKALEPALAEPASPVPTSFPSASSTTVSPTSAVVIEKRRRPRRLGLVGKS